MGATPGMWAAERNNPRPPHPEAEARPPITATSGKIRFINCLVSRGPIARWTRVGTTRGSGQGIAPVARRTIARSRADPVLHHACSAYLAGRLDFFPT